MAERAYIGNPDELVKFTASTTELQFPAAVSPISSLYRLSAEGQATVPSNLVLVTAQGEGVQIYSTNDSKCLRSWTFPPNVRFACPAKYFAKYDDAGCIGTSFVYAVLDSGDDVTDKNQGAVVWRWTDRGMESTGLEDKISMEYASPIFGLEAGVTMAGHLLAVHKDGSLTLATEDLKKVHGFSTSIAGDATVVWYQMMDISQSMRSYLDSRQVADWLEGDFRLALVISQVLDQSGDGDETDMPTYYVSLVTVDGREAVISECGTTQIHPTYLTAQPISCAFDADTGVMAILTLTGAYIQFSLTMGSSALDDAILLERTKEVVLRGFVPCLSDSGKVQDRFAASNLLTQTQLALTPLADRYVAIAGTHSVVSHSKSGPYESVLTLWDLQYGCMHAEKRLPVAPAHLNVHNQLPRLTYQIQTLGPRLTEQGTPSDQISMAITVAHTQKLHAAFDNQSRLGKVPTTKKGKSKPALTSAARASAVSWSVETFVASAYLPPVTLLASLRLQNNAKYFVDPVEQAARANVVHSSNILLHEEQEQGLGVLRSGWEAVVDGTAPVTGKKRDRAAQIEALAVVSRRRETTQQLENEVLLALANVSDAVDSDQYTLLFMDHIGVKDTADAASDASEPVWISAHLMTTVMRRCFAEPLGVSRSSRLPLFAPRVIEFMMTNCGLCNSHAPAPGLLPHLLARVDTKKCRVLTDDAAWRLVVMALQRCPDLPERHVVDVLRFQLKHYAEFVGRMFADQTDASDEAMDDEAMDYVTADVMRIVGAIAAIACNIDAMRLALSTLTLDHAACVIRLLIIWLRGWTQLGANVEIATSGALVAASSNALVRGLYEDDADYDDEDDDNYEADAPAVADSVRNTIIGAQTEAAPSYTGVPTVDAHMTLFVQPTVPQAKDTNPQVNHVFTRKWAPQLALPPQLMSAPALDQVIEFVSSVLDAHISRIILANDFHGLVQQLKDASDDALSVSDQLKRLCTGLLPFHTIWEKQQRERAASELAQQKVKLGLDEVVMLNGKTRSQAEREDDVQPNAKIAQGAGPSGTYWERIHRLEKYRVEVMHWE
ncbi:hypothetical protein GGI15_002609 [Coemansia interrupta]|uniref:Uncharacterized protein n=1 Tax=Coemansia interrupta TaxID=1126814 RepID=A0A9W8HH51_9FUNG|nr:hypothetical protein GGI15_002609 [Coemansia interrupta]